MKGQYPRAEAFNDPAELEEYLAYMESMQRRRRDKFAAAALMGFLANANFKGHDAHKIPFAVRKLADDVITELDRKETK